MSMKEPLLIVCTTHGIQPFHYLCTHLVYGMSNEWIEVDTGDDGREVESDYACPVCKPQIDNGTFNAAEHGSLACMMCVREEKPAVE